MKTTLLGLALVLFSAPSAWAQTPVACDQAANTLPGDPGASLEVVCPAGCAAGSLWGTGVYSDDSAVCTVAVHAGVLPAGAGGHIVVTIVGGQAAYVASEANGVASGSWGEWGRSFAVSRLAGGAIACDTAANTLAGDVGARIEAVCPANCQGGSVWGTGIYSDDSSICAAAIHAGLLPVAGGPVVIEVAAGQPAYVASEANGVSSGSWGEWGRSFVVLPAVP